MKPLLQLAQFEVLPGWVDYNFHMNDAAYALVFSRSVDALMEKAGLDSGGREQRQQTIYTLALHIRYLHEAKLGQAIAVSARILEMDARRVRVWLEMSGPGSVILSTSEQLLLCVSTAADIPRAAAFAPDIAARLSEIAALTEGEPFPRAAGQGISLRRQT